MVASMWLLLSTVPCLLFLHVSHGKSVGPLDKWRGEIEGEDDGKAPKLSKGLDAFSPERSLPLPPLPPSLRPTQGEFTFSMMIQPSRKAENLEADETDESLLMPAAPPSAPNHRSPQPPASSIAFRKNIGLVDEYSDDPFEDRTRGNASLPRSN